MNKNRFWLYWGIYLAFIIVVDLVLALLFPHAVKVNIFAIFPFLIFLALLQRGRESRLSHDYDEHFIDEDIYTEENGTYQVPWVVTDFYFSLKVRAAINLYLAPLMIPIGLFSSGYAMVFISIAVLGAALALPSVIQFIYALTKYMRHQKEVKKAREEQETHENSGKWK